VTVTFANQIERQRLILSSAGSSFGDTGFAARIERARIHDTIQRRRAPQRRDQHPAAPAQQHLGDAVALRVTGSIPLLTDTYRE